jgi:hypothetical protein
MKNKVVLSGEDKVTIPLGIFGMVCILGFVITAIYFTFFVWR